MSKDALTQPQLEVLRTRVREVRHRELEVRRFFEDENPERFYASEELRKTSRLYVAGGDGTVSLAMRAPDLPCPIGLLPCGTGNDFARGVGLPLDDLSAAIEIAVADETRRVDLGEVNDEVFANAVTVGFGAEATRDLDSGVKNWVGGLGYTLFTAWKALRAEPFETVIEAPDFRWEGRVMALVLVNGKTIGGGMEVGRASALDDGQLDLAWLPEFEGAGELAEVISDWREANPDGFSKVQYHQASRFDLHFGRSVAASIDGEVENLDTVTACSRPGIVEILCGGRSDGG